MAKKYKQCFETVDEKTHQSYNELILLSKQASHLERNYEDKISSKRTNTIYIK